MFANGINFDIKVGKRSDEAVEAKNPTLSRDVLFVTHWLHPVPSSRLMIPSRHQCRQ